MSFHKAKLNITSVTIINIIVQRRPWTTSSFLKKGSWGQREMFRRKNEKNREPKSWETSL